MQLGQLVVALHQFVALLAALVIGQQALQRADLLLDANTVFGTPAQPGHGFGIAAQFEEFARIAVAGDESRRRLVRDAGPCHCDVPGFVAAVAFAQDALEALAEQARAQGNGLDVATVDAQVFEPLGSQPIDRLVGLARALDDARKLAFVVDAAQRSQAHLGIGVGRCPVEDQGLAVDALQGGQAELGFRSAGRDLFDQARIVLGAQQTQAIGQRGRLGMRA